MITRSGTYTCERCGQTFDWIARMLEKNEGAFWKEPDPTMAIANIQVVNGNRLIATSKCPKCGAMQTKNLVDEPWDRVRC